MGCEESDLTFQRFAEPCVSDIPCQLPSSSRRDDAGFGVANSVRPCRGLVVRSAGFQAAMEDTDKPVGELSEISMMTDTSASDRVVIRAPRVILRSR